MIRCAQCRKVMKAKDVEIIYYSQVDPPKAWGLHPGCEVAYNGEEDEV